MLSDDIRHIIKIMEIVDKEELRGLLLEAFYGAEELEDYIENLELKLMED